MFYCGFPGYIDNGQTSGLDYYFGDSIINSCDEGFRLVGLRSQSCLGNGSWSGDRPECREIMCSLGDRFDHGVQLVNGRETDSGLLKIGDVVQYKCEKGFTLDGVRRVQCLEDGTLSHDQPICQPVPCTLPPM